MAFGMRDDVVRVFLGSWGFGFRLRACFGVLGSGIGGEFFTTSNPKLQPFHTVITP